MWRYSKVWLAAAEELTNQQIADQFPYKIIPAIRAPCPKMTGYVHFNWRNKTRALDKAQILLARHMPLDCITFCNG